MIFFYLFSNIAIILFSKNANGQLLTSFNLPIFDNLYNNEIKSESLLNNGPLILTPFIQSGNDALARKLAKVDKNLFLNVTSYAGYFTVDEKHHSNLFFWFFPAEGTDDKSVYEDDYEYFDGEDEDTDYDHEFLKKLVKRPPKGNDMGRLDDAEKPVVLWLQGGPGVSSLYALFTENGPFFVNMTSIRGNPWSWHRNYSILFIDNPVGTGFSFTDSEGFCTNITQTSKHLYKALIQFYEMFPFLRPNDFFIVGESFAGKYIPAIGYEINEQNKKSENYQKINLKGLALGNAFTDPYNMVDYSDFAYQLGLIGLLGYREMKITETLLRANYDTPLAKSYWDSTLYLFLKNSNFMNLYNIQQPQGMDLFPFYDFINQAHIRSALHVGSTPFSGPDIVYTKLTGDFMSSAMQWIEELLDDGMRIMYYNGNWDFICAYPLAENAFQKMKWKGAAKYRTAERRPLIIDDKLKGYITQADNFYEVAVLNAGHMVPADQPKVCLHMIDKFFKSTL